MGKKFYKHYKKNQQESLILNEKEKNRLIKIINDSIEEGCTLETVLSKINQCSKKQFSINQLKRFYVSVTGGHLDHEIRFRGRKENELNDYAFLNRSGNGYHNLDRQFFTDEEKIQDYILSKIYKTRVIFRE